jgi:hypothetical protein
MKWGYLSLLTVAVLLIILLDWPKINRNHKKERVSFLVVTAIGWSLSTMLIFFPDIPGPSQFMDWLLKPLGTWLEPPPNPPI